MQPEAADDSLAVLGGGEDVAKLMRVLLQWTRCDGEVWRVSIKDPLHSV